MSLKISFLFLLISTNVLTDTFAELPIGTFCKYASSTHEYIHFDSDQRAYFGSDVMGMPNPLTYLHVEKLPSENVKGTRFTITEKKKETDEVVGGSVHFTYWDDSDILFRGHWRFKDDFSPRFCVQ